MLIILCSVQDQERRVKLARMTEILPSVEINNRNIFLTAQSRKLEAIIAGTVFFSYKPVKVHKQKLSLKSGPDFILVMGLSVFTECDVSILTTYLLCT